MKLKNKLGCIILRDFNFYTLIIIIMLFLFYIYTLPYIAEYEEITNYSQKAYLINSVVDNLYFSSNFWHSPPRIFKRYTSHFIVFFNHIGIIIEFFNYCIYIIIYSDHYCKYNTMFYKKIIEASK